MPRYAMPFRVTIEQPTEGAADSYGETAATWSALKTVYMSVVPQGSREYERSKSLHEEMTHLVRIRYTSGVTAAMRIKWTRGTDTRYLYLTGPPVDPDERRRWLVLSCAEQV